MKTRAFTAVALAAVLGVVTSSRAQGGGIAPRPIVADAPLHQAGYGEYWSTSLPIGNDSTLAVHLLDENLYVTTRSGDLFALQADTGLLRWVRHLDDRLLRDRPPSHQQASGNDGPMLLVTLSTVNVFDRYTGEPVARLDLGFPASSGTVGDAATLFLGAANGQFYAIRWSADPCCTTHVLWHAMVDGTVTSTPVLALGRVYVVSDGGGVYCIARHSKTLIWEYDVGGDVSGGIQVDASGVYVAGLNRELLVLDPDTGGRVHSYRFPEVLLDGPTLVQRTLYQHCDGVGLYAFDVDTHNRLWMLPSARRFIARAAENLVLMDDAGDLLRVDNRDGRVRQKLDLPPHTLATTNTRDAVLYLVTPDGRVLCAKPLAFPYLRREAVIAARARLPFSPSDALGSPGDASTGSAPSSTVDRAARDPLRSRDRG